MLLAPLPFGHPVIWEGIPPGTVSRPRTLFCSFGWRLLFLFSISSVSLQVYHIKVPTSNNRPRFLSDSHDFPNSFRSNDL